MIMYNNCNDDTTVLRQQCILATTSRGCSVHIWSLEQFWHIFWIIIWAAEDNPVAYLIIFTRELILKVNYQETGKIEILWIPLAG